MDDLEFRKHATIEPGSQHPDFLDKIRQSRHKRRFVDEQLAFDRKLSKTLNISTPDNLTDRILLAQQLSRHKVQQEQQRRIWATSAAAIVILILSLFVMLPEPINSSHLSRQIMTHVHNDTHALNVHMAVPKSSIDTMLASYGGKLNGPIGKVTFLGHCIIGEHTGIHMVLNTRQGLITVMILPAQSIKHSQPLNDALFTGVVYPSKKGSIAIIAEKVFINPESIHNTRLNIDRNLNWII